MRATGIWICLYTPNEPHAAPVERSYCDEHARINRANTRKHWAESTQRPTRIYYTNKGIEDLIHELRMEEMSIHE